jgi:hypothetical protein
LVVNVRIKRPKPAFTIWICNLQVWKKFLSLKSLLPMAAPSICGYPACVKTF